MKTLITNIAGFICSVVLAMSQPTFFTVSLDTNLHIVTDMIQTGSGNFVIAGTDKHHTMVCVTSLSAEGEILWTKYLTGDMEWFANITEKADGNLLIPMHNYYALLIELNPSGDSVNCVYITETNQSLFSSLIEMNDSLIIAAEIIRNADPWFPGYDSSILVKMDEELNIIEKIPTQFSFQKSLTKISDSDFFSLGHYYSVDGSSYIKYNSDGEVLNIASCSDSSGSFIQHRINRLNSNMMTAIGFYTGYKSMNSSISRFDPSGEIEYCTFYDLPYFMSVAHNETLEYLYAMGNDNINCTIYKLDYTGNQISTFTLNDSLYGNNIIFSSGSLYISGHYDFEGLYPGSRFIKLNADSVFSITSNIEIQKVNVYPNPAKDYVEFQVSGIRFHVGSEIRVKNVMGEDVARLPVKSERTVWDCRDAKEGIYFYYLDAHAQKYFGKIILQK